MVHTEFEARLCHMRFSLIRKLGEEIKDRDRDKDKARVSEHESELHCVTLTGLEFPVSTRLDSDL